MWKTLIILIVGDQAIIYYNDSFLLERPCIISQTIRTLASFMLNFWWFKEFVKTDDISDSGNLPACSQSLDLLNKFSVGRRGDFQ